MRKVCTPMALLLAMLILVSLPVGAWSVEASAAEEGTVSFQEIYVNPLYSDVISEDDLVSNERPILYADGEEVEYLTTVEDAGAAMREAMKQRQEEIVIPVRTTRSTEEELTELLYEINDAALVHTGEPTEGDYLMWQYGGWDGGAKGYSSDGYSYMTYTYAVTYYTTVEEEAEVDAAVEALLTELAVADETDYQKLCAIYDYICANVVYDYDHVNNTNYKHQYTAYGALIDGTSVCQGYAVLLYRLALELDVDCRLIAGTGNGEAHGWNIARLGNLYYNLDSTWDAGKTEYGYFLKSDDDFGGHVRDEEYATDSFYTDYPMGAENYTYCEHKFGEGVITESPTCGKAGTMTYTCAVCGTVRTEKIAATGEHVYDDGVITEDATCTEVGVKTYTCTVCGGIRTEEIADLGGHVYDGGVITEDATCTEVGVKTYTCTVCGETQTEEVAAIGHNWNSTVIEPTCTAEGYTEYTCSVCGEQYSDSYTDKLAHTFVDGLCVECGERAFVRVSGADRCETAIRAADEMKTRLGVDEFDVIIYASGDNFADALSGSYLAARKQAPVLLYRSGAVQKNLAYIQENLSGDGVVYLLGGTAAIPKSVETELQDAGIEAVRLYGKTRFETNLEILKEAGVSSDQEILVCTGYNFADSLSASAAGLPILMVNNNSGELTEGQSAYLENLSGNSFCIIGGSAAVSEELETTLDGYGSVDRIGGKTRYETSVMVADRYFENPGAVVLAYAFNFPDGLCGGPLAYVMDAPLILTATDHEEEAAAFVDESDVSQCVVLGGAKLISDEAVEEILG